MTEESEAVKKLREAMDKKAKQLSVHIDSAEKQEEIPEYDQLIRCEPCNSDAEDGFGLAGGGFGIYNYCKVCGRILSKSIVEE